MDNTESDHVFGKVNTEDFANNIVSKTLNIVSATHSSDDDIQIISNTCQESEDPYEFSELGDVDCNNLGKFSSFRNLRNIDFKSSGRNYDSPVCAPGAFSELKCVNTANEDLVVNRTLSKVRIIV